MKQELYPELHAAGGLTNGLNQEFIRIGSRLKVSSVDGLNPGLYARISTGYKYSQVMIAAEEKLYLPDFWKHGVCLGHGRTDSLTSLAECLNFWLTVDCTLQELISRFDFISTSERAMAFEAGNETEYNWRRILNDEGRSELRSFVQLAIEDEILGKLFPFTSLNTLCFSRCTGYPYTYDLPKVTPLNNERYIVRLNDGTSLDARSADEAFQMVKAHLPENLGPAVKGTAENL